MIPEFLESPGVLGIGEIGLNKNTRNEATVFLEHLDLAAARRYVDLILGDAETPAGTRARAEVLSGLIAADGKS